SSPTSCSIAPCSSGIVRKSGASSEKSCGGNVARNRLNRPCSSCRARGGVPYGIGVAPASGRRQPSIRSDENHFLKSDQLFTELMCKRFHPSTRPYHLPHSASPAIASRYNDDLFRGLAFRPGVCGRNPGEARRLEKCI